MNRLKLFAVLAALAVVPVSAHEKGGDRAMGVVASVAPERIVVRTSDGHDVAFTVTPDTRFVRQGKGTPAEDVHVGERAVVHGKRVRESLEALEVKLGTVPATKK
jgi:hypothetical protein